MKKVFALCLILVFCGAAVAIAIGDDCDGFCCVCSRTAGCHRITQTGVWGSTTCPASCPGPIHLDCFTVPPPGHSDEAVSWVTREEAEQTLLMSLPDIIVNCGDPDPAPTVPVLVGRIALTR